MKKGAGADSPGALACLRPWQAGRHQALGLHRVLPSPRYGFMRDVVSAGRPGVLAEGDEARMNERPERRKGRLWRRLFIASPVIPCHQPFSP